MVTSSSHSHTYCFNCSLLPPRLLSTAEACHSHLRGWLIQLDCFTVLHIRDSKFYIRCKMNFEKNSFGETFNKHSAYPGCSLPPLDRLSLPKGLYFLSDEDERYLPRLPYPESYSVPTPRFGNLSGPTTAPSLQHNDVMPYDDLPPLRPDHPFGRPSMPAGPGLAVAPVSAFAAQFPNEQQTQMSRRSRAQQVKLKFYSPAKDIR